MSSLKSLQLAGNDLNELPAGLATLSLEKLDLSRNEGLNTEENWAVINQLTELTHLTFQEAALKELPKTLTVHKKLIELDLSNNPIERIPDAWIELPNLQRLDLSATQVSAVPSNMNRYPALRFLRLANCQNISAKLLIEHLKEVALYELDLSNSTLEDFPETWSTIAANRLIVKGTNLEAGVLEQLEENLLYTTIISE